MGVDCRHMGPQLPHRQMFCPQRGHGRFISRGVDFNGRYLDCLDSVLVSLDPWPLHWRSHVPELFWQAFSMPYSIALGALAPMREALNFFLSTSPVRALLIQRP